MLHLYPQAEETQRQVQKVLKSKEILQERIEQLTPEEMEDVWNITLADLPNPEDIVFSDDEPTVQVNVLPSNVNVPHRLFAENQALVISNAFSLVTPSHQ